MMWWAKLKPLLPSLQRHHHINHNDLFTNLINRRIKHPSQPSCTRSMFWEPDRKGPVKYRTAKKFADEMRFEDSIYYGSKIFIEECKLNLLEWKDHFTVEPHNPEPYKVEKKWDFKDKETVDSWRVTSDSDWDEGFSSCSFTHTGKSGLFKGVTDDTLPGDRTITRAGWCNITSPDAKKSFFREHWYDWEGFTHMVMRVRGDGRTYAICIRTTGTFDLTWFDLYTFGLYTHGGPYWQYVRIPFSRFVFTSKGAAQDYQEWLPLFQIRSFGITMIDKIPGPFKLEIEYIGLEFDPTHNEKSAYERYLIPESRYQVDG